MSTAVAPSRGDPTKTKTTRRRFGERLRGEYDPIIAQVREDVGDRDWFNVETEALAVPRPLPPTSPGRRDQQIETFLAWLREQLRNGPLSVVSRERNQYLRTAVRAALRQADRELRAAGINAPTDDQRDDAAVLSRDPYAELLASHRARTVRELEGVVDAVVQQTQRELDSALATQVTASELAPVVVGRLDKVGKTRSTAVAVTEPVRLHADTTLDRFDEYGVEEVTAKAEYKTAGDQHVCPQCRPFEGRILSLEEARSLIPQHPGCRCRWSLVDGEDRERPRIGA
jgi:SPP1 gp7 family putative phage head morphogenesis protein